MSSSPEIVPVSTDEAHRSSLPKWQATPARWRYIDEFGEYVFRGLLPTDDRRQDAEIILEDACARIRAQHPDLTNEQFYDALCEALVGPEQLERESLQRFMTWVVKAIQHMVGDEARCEQQQRPTPALAVDGPSDTGNTYPLNSPTTLYYAHQFPNYALKRLQALAVFRERHPVDAEIYDLYDFLGCDDEEISLLLDLPVTTVLARRLHATSIVRSHENQIE